jgi:hypothetical protein
MMIDKTESCLCQLICCKRVQAVFFIFYLRKASLNLLVSPWPSIPCQKTIHPGAIPLSAASSFDLPESLAAPNLCQRNRYTMKTLLALLLLSLIFAADAAANAGPGPWSSGAYYPGGTDGKYQAAVYGDNITGVIGFAIREGSPTVLQQTNTTAAAGGGGGEGEASAVAAASFSAATAAAQAFDATQNYFVIFVEGRTYSGLAVGSVNPVGKTVTGALLGAQPDFGFVTNNLPFEFPETTFTTNTNITDLRAFTNQLITNTDIAIIGFTPEITITNLPGVTNTFVTNTTVLITNNGIVTETNIAITNVVSTDPITITNTNQVPIFQTNTFVQTSLAESITLITNTNVTANTFSFSVEGIQATTNTFDPLPILNRGLSGGFQAKLKNNQAYMTFRGDGELSTPSQLQTVDLATNAAGNNISGTIETHTVPFKVDGLRTSFLTTLAPAAPTAGTSSTR